MRSIALLFLLAGTSLYAQQAVALKPTPASSAPPADSFRFVSDGPAGPGWSRPDEIARKYFHENLTALFERTVTLDAALPERAALRWIFTGPRAGLTVELTSSKVRISERHYDSTALYEGQGNFPEKATFTDERQFTGEARSLTVIADAHLAVRVLVNGQQLIEAPLLFESGSPARYTATIAVVAADGLRAQRLAGRDQVSLGEREALQLSQAEKARRATYVVVNDGSVEQLRERLSGLLEQLNG